MRATNRINGITACAIISLFATGVLVGIFARLFTLPAFANASILGDLIPLELLLAATAGCSILAFALAQQSKMYKRKMKETQLQTLEFEQQRRALNAHSIVITTNGQGS
jgi:hypothetical protein